MRDGTWALVLALVYFGAARVGLSFATVGKSVTLVWPPSGIALAALVLGGRRLWPGVFVGALAVNAWTPGVPLLSALGMAGGNTLEAVLAATLLSRTRFDRSLERMSDLLRFVALGAVVSTVAAATVGAGSLIAGGVIPARELGTTWLVWWVGDLIGDLVFAPAVLTLGALRHRRFSGKHVIEAAMLVGVFALLAATVFGYLPLVPGRDFPQGYALFPVRVWAALRFGVPGAALINLALASIVVWSTVNGRGPYVQPTLGASLLYSQTFLGVAVLTSLAFAAVVAERDRAIGRRDEFLSLASHELNTPLTPLMLSLQTLEKKLAGDDNAPRITAARRQVDRLKRLVASMLDVVRGRAQLELSPTRFELGALVTEIADGFRDEIAGHGCTLDLAIEPVTGAWDRDRLGHAIANLLTNAMKYGRGKPIQVTVRQRDDVAELIVADAGVGISAADRARIFGRFQRGAGTEHFPGIGLGLYLVQRIVAAHGGEITVASTPGAGATFTVSLPLAP